MNAWDEFIKLQEIELGSQVVQKWLRPLKVIHYDAVNLFLRANDSFQIHWFEEHVRKKAQERLLNNNGKRIKVHISIESTEVPIKKRPKKAKAILPPLAPKFTIAFDELDPLCTFQNFHPTNGNLLAYKLLSEQSELVNFNPIYLYGPSGIGKTHLLMATAHLLREQNLVVTYVRAETFTEHVVTAIRAGEMNLFRQSYRTTDVLIIDDVHVFARKSATQEEVFHTFNALHLVQKQIILSANCSPGELHDIEPRLVSRFEWGLVIPITIPNKEDMRLLLQAKCVALKCSLKPQILEFLLETFNSSCKAVTRALEALIVRAHLNGMQLTLPLARKYLSDLIEEEKKSALNPEKIIQQVTDFFGMRPDDILGKAQTRDCVLPRQMAMYICRTQLNLPFMRIGDLFSKDHSTVMSSVKSIQKGIDNNDANISTPFHTILKKLMLNSER